MECVNSAVAALKALPGVSRVEGSPHTFLVVYDPTRVTPQQVTRILEDNEFKIGEVASQP